MSQIIKLHHFIWRSKNTRGYTKDIPAYSEGFNPYIYKRWMGGSFVPVSYKAKRDEDYRPHMIFQKGDHPQFLLSILSWDSRDEHGRRTLKNHATVVPKKMVAEGKIDIFEICEAMKDFETQYNRPDGDIPPLEVEKKENFELSYKNRLPSILIKSSLESLSTIFLKNGRNKAFLIGEEASRKKRREIMLWLFEFFLDAGIRPLSMTSEIPRRDYFKVFDFFVTPKYYSIPRNKHLWKYIYWDQSEEVVEKPSNHESVYQHIEDLYTEETLIASREEKEIGKDRSSSLQEISQVKVDFSERQGKNLDKNVENTRSEKKADHEMAENDGHKSNDGSENNMRKSGMTRNENLEVSDREHEEEGEEGEEENRGDQIIDETSLESLDEEEKARYLLKKARKKHGSIDFTELEDFIGSSNFDLEIFKVKLENLKEKGEKISRENRKEKASIRLKRSEENGSILQEDYQDLKNRLECEEKDISCFEERLQEAKKRKKLHLLIEEISKGFEISENIKEKVIRQGKKNIEVPSGELKAGEIKEELDQIKENIKSYYRRLEDDQEKSKDKINNVEDLALDYIPVDFGDVAGMSDLKKRLSMAVESPIEDYEVILESTGSPPENSGILLYGPPGVGKTFMARAVAGEYQLEYGLDVVDVPMEAIYGLHWSKQVERIVDIFQLSEEKSPSMVIWDEFDSYAADPKLSGRKYDEKKTTTFKQKFEGMMESENMVLHIATSNYPWKLELPLIRPGRLGEIIFVPPPDRSAREEIMRLFSSEAKIDGVDFKELAKKTENATISNLENIVKKAAKRPVKEWRNQGKNGDPRPCTMDDFLWALEEENLHQYESWLKEAKRELERPKLESKAKLFLEIMEEYERIKNGGTR